MKSRSSFLVFMVNPFEKIAGGKALLIGLAAIILTSYIGSAAGVAFDGVIDVHLYAHSFLFAIIVQFVSWIVLTFIAWVAAKIVRAGKFRFIDLAGTLAFAEIPFFFLAFTGFVPAFQQMIHHLFANLPVIFLFTFVCFIFIGLSLYWMYRAFAVSTNLVKPVHIVTFFVALFIAEAVAFSINNLGIREIENDRKTEQRLQSIPDDRKELALAKTKEITHFFSENDIDESITSLFNHEMLAGLPIEDLEATWHQIQNQFGKFRGFEDDTKISLRGDNVVTETTGRFEKISFILQLSFDENANISGLYVKPKLF